jgi:hypothetical protein
MSLLKSEICLTFLENSTIIRRSIFTGRHLIMAEKIQNTWPAKAKRTVTAFLPVADNRKGQCVSCGACCKLPTVCPFLKYDSEEKSYCTIYPIRPLNCRKYPRTESELITGDTCGFKFEAD